MSTVIRYWNWKLSEESPQNACVLVATIQLRSWKMIKETRVVSKLVRGLGDWFCDHWTLPLVKLAYITLPHNQKKAHGMLKNYPNLCIELAPLSI